MMTHRGGGPGADGRYDVVIVGGGPAGLSAALMLGRARRSALVIDNGEPRNAPAAHMHGYLSRDGAPPGTLLAVGCDEVVGYGVEIARGRAVSAARDGAGFAVELDAGRIVRARRLLVASGIVDELPDVPGLAGRWGRDVLHCPYCHGWEVRGQRIGVLVTSPMSVHQALLFRQWTDRLTLLLHAAPPLDEQDAERLAARDITVVRGEVVGVEVAQDRLTGISMATGELIPLDALAVAPRSVPRSSVASGLGLEPSPHPSGMGEHIAADDTGLTPVPGVWVSGNLANPAANVLGAANAGAIAAGAINADLIIEETNAAVQARRNPFCAESEARLCEQVMGERRHGR
ncbi:NAD(P)/FAD-dependent oxidoreductase [Pseudonocardia xinjiangensis]|uniref:NAD(P)/FAD-dependent oxidoreductase n=1 Tax=Pseudonocardia xinjiangensis TaxID=75289 RepID=UPI003D8A1FC8